MKIVKLDKQQLTDWRTNTSHLVDDDGHLVAKLDPDLERALGTVTLTAKGQKKSVSQRVAIGRAPNRREYHIEVTVQRLGRDMNDVTLSQSIDGHRVVSGRDVLCAQMLQEHGECQLRWPNGVILKVVRDPSRHRPTFKESLQVAPRPEHCPCKNWGVPHPGRHFSTCEWNRLAPPEEQALTDHVTQAEIEMLPTGALRGLARQPTPNPAVVPIAAKVDPRAVVIAPPELDSPESCRNGCLSWATPKGIPIPAGQHHPTCLFAKPWAIKTARETPRWLVDLHTGEKVRVATDAEVGEADIAAKKSGSPIIHIDETSYAVILESELDAAAELGDPGATGAPGPVGANDTPTAGAAAQ